MFYNDDTLIVESDFSLLNSSIIIKYFIPCLNFNQSCKKKQESSNPRAGHVGWLLGVHMQTLIAISNCKNSVVVKSCQLKVTVSHCSPLLATTFDFTMVLTLENLKATFLFKA